MSAQALNELLPGPPEGYCALRNNCFDCSPHLSREGAGGEIKCCCVSRGGKSGFSVHWIPFRIKNTCSFQLEMQPSGRDESFLSESCMKVGSQWKWESSPRAGKGTAHDNQRKEMSPTQIKWGRKSQAE